MEKMNKVKKGKKDLFGCNHGLKTICVQVHTKIYFRNYDKEGTPT